VRCKRALGEALHDALSLLQKAAQLDPQRLQMNSYISLILEAEGAKERLRGLVQSAPEPEKPGLRTILSLGRVSFNRRAI